MGRRLGQHFLRRSSLLERIAAAACPETEPLVIEIGAGYGALTAHLLPRAERLIAIETDRRLAGRLKERFAGVEKLQVIAADVLQTDLAQWGQAVVTGNLPYYITSPVLRKTLALGGRLRRAVFLVQKEVAERLTAQPGGRQYGFLTVQTLLAATPELLFPVPPAAFSPPPKVESAVVRLTPRAPGQGWTACRDARFHEFLSRCFQQKRKTIRNNLAEAYGREVLSAIPETALRAEQLPAGRFVALFERLEAARGAPSGPSRQP